MKSSSLLMAFNFEYPYVDPTQYNADWLLKKMKDLLARMDTMDEWRAEYEEAYEDYKKLVEDVEAGTFPPSIVNAFNKWMSKNALDLVGAMVKNVFFGLTDDGYFVAFIPENWDDIIFGTKNVSFEIELFSIY